MEIPIPIKIKEEWWQNANRDVLWGWKRDCESEQRTILFGASLINNALSTLRLEDWYFFYRNRSCIEEISEVLQLLKGEDIKRLVGTAVARKCPRTKLGVVELSGGPGFIKYQPLLRRLLNRRPRRRIPTGSFPAPTCLPLNLSDFLPIAAYVGSGLSYEAGLPTLASVHETFGVDHLGDDQFIFGARDPIPRQLADSVAYTFGRFVHFHLLAATTTASLSHLRLATLYDRGVVTRILTDNVDNLFAQIPVPFTRTRGIGVFNDRFEIKFDRNERTLLVIGVAADRRDIINQARKQGLRIVVVNPHAPVSPMSQNLSYLRPKDRWYRMSAHNFFERFVHE